MEILNWKFLKDNILGHAAIYSKQFSREKKHYPLLNALIFYVSLYWI